MPLPTLSDVHINAALTNLSVAYIADNKNYIADKMFPIVPVKKQSDSYFVFGKADFFRDDARRRVPASESAGFGYTLSSSSYSCDLWAAHYDLADKIRANFDSPLSADQAAVAFITQKLLIRRDRQFASDYLATSVWGQDVAGVAAAPTSTQHIFWDNASADIIGDVHKWSDDVQKKTGHRPNKMCVGQEVWRVMKNDADIVDRIKYTMAEPVSEQIVAKLLGLDELLIVGSSYNTAAENATASMSFIAGDVALLTYSAPAPSLMLPSAGYTFSWSDFDVVRGGGASIRQFRMENLQADRYEGEMAFDFGVVSSDCGVFFNDVLT